MTETKQPYPTNKPFGSSETFLRYLTKILPICPIVKINFGVFGRFMAPLIPLIWRINWLSSALLAKGHLTCQKLNRKKIGNDTKRQRNPWISHTSNFKACSSQQRASTRSRCEKGHSENSRRHVLPCVLKAFRLHQPRVIFPSFYLASYLTPYN